MEFSVRHYMKGRVRLYIPDLCRDRGLSENAIGWLKQQQAVRNVRINYDCSSLVIDFDSKYEELFRNLFGRLRLITKNDLAAIISMGLSESPTRHEARELLNNNASRIPNYPLTLPTLSLVMAFAANPWIRLINTPLILWNAYPIAVRAYDVWRKEKRLNVDFLDTLAISASLIQGNLVAGSLITWLIKLGDWIRDLTASGSKRAISDLLEYRNKTAWVLREGNIVSVESDHLRVGDHVVVFPGEMIPVDGEIIEGRALIDQKTITGEGLPVSRTIGEAAFAATVIREGQIILRAVSVGNQTTAGQIVKLIDSAPVGDTRMQNHAEKLADKLVMPTLGLATATTVLTGDFNRFLSLVIVDYGTGIRVAAPTAVLSSMTRAARSGIIIKSGRHMERLAEVDTIIFDKTGTLTSGLPEVSQVITYDENFSEIKLIGMAAAAESKLQHPVAEAIRRKARRLGCNITMCNEPKYSVGMGVEAEVDGYEIHIGNERFMRHANININKSSIQRSNLENSGYSCLYLAVDGNLAALIPYADQIRPESQSIIRRLNDLGIKNTIMLTGDNSTVARAVSEKLSISRYIADMLPADKADVVKDLQSRGHVVAMVGDGINDSPALSYADVGIAMKHGAQVTHESADVVLMEDSLEKLLEAVDIARGSIDLIKQNYAIVIGMNTVALALSLPGGLVSPSVTALISNGSAILASVNAIRPLIFNFKR
jgi:manganese/zinc-transporting P-type ATPase C